MSWRPSPSAGPSSSSSSSSPSRPAKRQRTVKVEDRSDEQVPLHAIPPVPATPVLPTPSNSVNEEVMHLAQEQKSAIDLITSGSNVFLTGRAGSGKTVVLKIAIARLRDQGKRVRIAAPTGRAAKGVGGITLHSLFGLTPKKMDKSMHQLERMVATNEGLRQRLLETDVLIIDEISMVENIFFERLGRMMLTAKESDENFGGCQLIVCGDFRQLPPVEPFSWCFTCGVQGGKNVEKKRNWERKVTVYKCPVCLNDMDETHQWAFESQAWKEAHFTNIYLRQNHRQQEESFVRCLDKLGQGLSLSQTERNLLYHHPCDVEGAIYLYPTNLEVDGMNDKEFKKINSEYKEYKCVDDFDWNPVHEEYRDFRFVSRDGFTLQALTQHPYKPTLQLKLDMPVVLITNLDVPKGLVNGSQGVVIGFRQYNAATLPRSAAGRDDLDSTVDGTGPSVLMNFRGGRTQYYRHEQMKKFVLNDNRDKELPIVQFHGKEPMTIFPDCNVYSPGR